MRLERSRTALVVIDVQERLFPFIHEHARVEAALDRLVRGAGILEIPIVVTEQYVKGLGPTLPALQASLGSAYSPIEKMSFSCGRDNTFLAALEARNPLHVLLAGIEAHVCVYQTAIDLLDRGYHVHLVCDAVGSRSAVNRDVALRRIEQGGGLATTVEMSLFELLGVAGTAEFKAISRIVR